MTAFSSETPARPDLTPAARGLSALLDGVTESQLDARTPCEEYRVRDLVAHLLGLTVAFRDAARKERGPGTDLSPDDPAAPVPSLAGDWRGRLRGRLAEVAAAWRDPAAWEGTTRAGGVTMPGEVAGLVALNELFLHGWDLARATGQAYPCDDATARASLALMSQDADDASREGSGFGPVVAVLEDAPLLDRALGMSGRDPGWRP